jgi:hypothetical protein
VLYADLRRSVVRDENQAAGWDCRSRHRKLSGMYDGGGESSDFGLYRIARMALRRCQNACNWQVAGLFFVCSRIKRNGSESYTNSGVEVKEFHVCLVSSSVHHCWPMLTFSFCETPCLFRL